MGGHAGLPDVWRGAGAVYRSLPSSSNINGWAGTQAFLMSGVALVLSIGLSPLLVILMGGHAGLPDVWCGAGAVNRPLPASSDINGWARRPS
jgi:hypothetical protein